MTTSKLTIVLDIPVKDSFISFDVPSDETERCVTSWLTWLGNPDRNEYAALVREKDNSVNIRMSHIVAIIIL